MLDFLKKKPESPKEFSGHSDQCYGHITYAQSGEDMYLANIFAFARIHRPTYLDLGANIPIACSNTAWLYKRGSRGVVVEANPDLIEGYRAERPEDKILNIGVGPKSGSMPFYRFDNTSGRNSFSKELIDQFIEIRPGVKLQDTLQIAVLTLDEILADYFTDAPPDFLSIDVEGLDFDILKNTKFPKGLPPVLCAEIRNGRGDDISRELTAMLANRGYVPHAKTWANGIYVRPDIAEKISL